MAGDKIQNGIVFGIAESVSAFLSGYLCVYVSDTAAYLSMAFLCFGANLLFYLNSDSTLLLFLIVFGIGAMLNIFYLIVETRVLP